MSKAEQAMGGGGRPPVDVEDLLPLYRIGGEAYLGYRIVLAGRLFDRCIQGILRTHGPVTLPQWRVISQLGRLPRGTVRSLADGAAVDRSEVSRELRKLETDGLIQRQVNPDDGRSPLFSLTPQGLQTFKDLRAPISRFIRYLVEEVDAEDLSAANRVLWRVIQGSLSADPEDY